MRGQCALVRMTVYDCAAGEMGGCKVLESRMNLDARNKRPAHLKVSEDQAKRDQRDKETQEGQETQGLLARRIFYVDHRG